MSEHGGLFGPYPSASQCERCRRYWISTWIPDNGHYCGRPTGLCFGTPVALPVDAARVIEAAFAMGGTDALWAITMSERDETSR